MMPRLPHAGKRMAGVECFVLRNRKLYSVGCIDLLADTLRARVFVVRSIFLAPVLVPRNSLHFSNVVRYCPLHDSHVEP